LKIEAFSINNIDGKSFYIYKKSIEFTKVYDIIYL